MSYFITFEGIEGCGKSTHSILLAEYLHSINYDVLLTREPGGPPISEKIRAILLDRNHSEMLPQTELLLYMASRSQHTGEWIKPALKEGKIVICDRYYDSSLAYQGGGRDLDLKVIRSITKFATFGLVPDCTILIDIPVEIGIERIKQKTPDRIESESIHFHEKVRNLFLDVAKEESKRYIIINGNKNIEDIQAQIRELVLRRI
ncbi:MAG: dTMP kinase [Candidatus Cloacimonetes bacterium]|nr:dTMP kinase [Candidatus Cloacimonadota bacterium]